MKLAISYAPSVGDVPPCPACGRRGQQVWLEVSRSDDGHAEYGPCSRCRNHVDDTPESESAGVDLEPWKRYTCRAHPKCVRQDGHHGQHLDADGAHWDYGACTLDPVVRDCPKCRADDYPIGARPVDVRASEPRKWRSMVQMDLFGGAR